MSNSLFLKKSEEGIIFYDYSDFMGIPCGIILRNDNQDIDQLDTAIIKNVGFPPEHDGFFVAKLNQKHTNVVIQASENIDQPADGVFATSDNYLLIIRTADCYPVALYDGETAALLHLGWRSAFSGILDNFYHRVSDFNYSKAKAFIGPGIGSCCFEVSSEVALLFPDKYRKYKNKTNFINLRGFILDELKGYGIKYILDAGACTACNPELYYSYRREGNKVGQMLSFIRLRRSK